MKHTKEDYLNSGFYDGDDSDIENYKKKIVTCRKPHNCNGGCDGVIKIGEDALLETGFIDGKPVTCHTCLHCIDKWLGFLREENTDNW